jgi:hypothetical protein
VRLLLSKKKKRDRMTGTGIGQVRFNPERGILLLQSIVVMMSRFQQSSLRILESSDEHSKQAKVSNLLLVDP